ncbi:MAG: 50S ribosomal protein L5 [Rickettsiales bacterium]|jgi:large subunit ribosomal protein L5|nr:50S ribosomal protein L5 [Rickettsiales bacterium]
MSFVKDSYNTKIAKDLKEKFKFSNDLQIPKLDKVCLNVAFRGADVDNNFVQYVLETLSRIAGQKAVIVKAKKSIATFKVREGMNIACRVTLRKNKMYEFLDRLVYIALPRIKDFRGLSPKAFNQSDHYTFGIKEHTIFPEVELDKLVRVFGMDINIVSNAKNREEALALLKGLNFPIK